MVDSSLRFKMLPIPAPHTLCSANCTVCGFVVSATRVAHVYEGLATHRIAVHMSYASRLHDWDGLTPKREGAEIRM